MTSADKFARNARNRLKRSYHPIRVRVDTGKSIDDFYMNISRSAWQTVKLPAKWFQQLKTKHFDVHVLCISGCNSPEIWVVGTKRAPSKLCPRRKNKTNMSKLHISKQKLKNRCRKRKPSLIIRYQHVYLYPYLYRSVIVLCNSIFVVIMYYIMDSIFQPKHYVQI